MTTSFVPGDLVNTRHRSVFFFGEDIKNSERSLKRGSVGLVIAVDSHNAVLHQLFVLFPGPIIGWVLVDEVVKVTP